MKKNTKVLVVLFLVLNLTLTSCGYKDIDKRIFAVSIGVSKSEDTQSKYTVIIKFAIPTADIKAGQKDFLIVKSTGDSITEAIRMIKSKVDKEIDFSHTKMILFDQNILQKDLRETIDWFIRRRDIQKIAWVGIGSPNVEDILNLKPKSESLPANALFLSFGHTGTESPYIVTEFLFDFRKRLTEKGLDPFLPIIKVNNHEEYTINTAAIFDKKGIKLVLEEEETKVLNILLNRAKKLDIKVNIGEDDSFFIAGDVAKASYKIKDGKTPIVEVKIELEGILEESDINVQIPQLSKYEKEAEKQVKGRVEHTIKLFQKENVDPIGLGLLYRGTHFEEDDFKRWKEIYPNLVFDVKVELTLQGTGLLK